MKFSLLIGGEMMLDEALIHALRLEATKEADRPTCKATCGKGWSALKTMVVRDQVQQNWVTHMLAMWGCPPS
jgi:hypothetical protein